MYTQPYCSEENINLNTELKTIFSGLPFKDIFHLMRLFFSFFPKNLCSFDVGLLWALVQSYIEKREQVFGPKNKGNVKKGIAEDSKSG